MKQHLCLTLLIIVTICAAQKSNFNRRISGEATFYGANADGGGTCMYNNPTHNPSGLVTVAIGDFGNAEKCGMCVMIYPKGTGKGASDFPKRQPFMAYVNNQCPECGPNNLDIAQDSDGRWDMEWEAVDCPVQGNIQVQLKTGSSVWHTEISARNFRVPISTMEYFIDNKWTSLARRTYNYFVLTGNVNGKLPISVRMTSVFDEQVTFTINNYDRIEPSLIDTGVQFKGSGSSGNPPPPPRPNPPASNPPTNPPSNPTVNPPAPGSCSGHSYSSGNNGDNVYWIEVDGNSNDRISVRCSSGDVVDCTFQWGKHACAPSNFACQRPRIATVNGVECALDGQSPPPPPPPPPVVTPPPPPVVTPPPPPVVTPPPPPPVVSPPPPVQNPSSPTVSTPMSKVLEYSLLFFEAQRSGKLGSTHVSWRGDTFVNDGSDVGTDLSGGYFDAGDHFKFGLPMAFTVTTLAWGGIEYASNYKLAGKWNDILAAVKWGTDYFIKCWKESSKTLYVQVGKDTHSIWKAPEDYTADEIRRTRISLAISPNAPGADVAGETAASFAAASILFKDSDLAYSNLLLSKAKSLYAFALETQGSKYSDSVKDANPFYTSWSGSDDEICWGGAWLYRATADAKYLQNAMSVWDKVSWAQGPISWDSKAVGCKVLLAQLTSDARVTGAAAEWADKILSNPTNADGLIWFDVSQWGSNRHAMNAMFPLIVYGDRVAPANKKSAIETKVKQQLAYILGNNKNKVNYVVGAAPSSPKRCHHRGASGTTSATAPGDNKYILYGALVGGPDQQGNWADDRNDYVKNEVAMDYNAGFTGVLARFASDSGISLPPTNGGSVPPTSPPPPSGGSINCNTIAHAFDPTNIYWVEISGADGNSALRLKCSGNANEIPCTFAFGTKWQCNPNGGSCNHPRQVISGSTTCPLPASAFRTQAASDSDSDFTSANSDEISVDSNFDSDSDFASANSDETAANSDEFFVDPNLEFSTDDTDAAVSESSEKSSQTLPTGNSKSPLSIPSYAIGLIVIGSILLIVVVLFAVITLKKKNNKEESV